LESLDVGSLYLHTRCIFRIYGSVRIWRSSGQAQRHKNTKGHEVCVGVSAMADQSICRSYIAYWCIWLYPNALYVLNL